MPDEFNVLVTKPFPDDLLEKLRSVSPRLSVTRHVAEKPEDLPASIGEIDVLYTSRALPQPEDAPHLKWVQLHFAGLDHIADHPLLTESDVIVTTMSGIHTVNMAEYVLGQMLAAGHHFPRMLKDKASANWPGDRWARYVPRELRGATVGIVGYGSVGREVARLADAFGMVVLAMKHDLRHLAQQGYILPGTGDPGADIPARIYPVAALHSFLGECDYVVIAVPLTDATRNLIDAAALDAMKPTAMLINVARGGIVDEKALVDALKKNKIGWAALDVFAEEPLPADSPLWGLPNVVISPHVSGFTPQYDERATDLFAENLRRFVVGEGLMNVVDRERGY
jgi:phosphoglycerate dehydrogenase-like enzyme